MGVSGPSLYIQRSNSILYHLLALMRKVSVGMYYAHAAYPYYSCLIALKQLFIILVRYNTIEPF